MVRTVDGGRSDDPGGKIRVLHVDDDPAFADLTASFLRKSDPAFAVSTSTNPDEALEQFRESDFDCVVSDHDMPGATGLELLEQVREDAVEHGPTGGRPDADADGVGITIGALDGGFYVEDDGPGIDPEERESVFEYGYSTAPNGTERDSGSRSPNSVRTRTAGTSASLRGTTAAPASRSPGSTSSVPQRPTPATGSDAARRPDADRSCTASHTIEEEAHEFTRG